MTTDRKFGIDPVVAAEVMTTVIAEVEAALAVADAPPAPKVRAPRPKRLPQASVDEKLEWKPAVKDGIGYLKNWIVAPRVPAPGEDAGLRVQVALALDCEVRLVPVVAQMADKPVDWRYYDNEIRLTPEMCERLEEEGVIVYRDRFLDSRGMAILELPKNTYGCKVGCSNLVLLDGWLVGPEKDPFQPMWLCNNAGTAISLWQCTQQDLNFGGGTRLANIIELGAQGQKENKTKAFGYGMDDAVRMLVAKKQTDLSTLLKTHQTIEAFRGS